MAMYKKKPVIIKALKYELIDNSEIMSFVNIIGPAYKINYSNTTFGDEFEKIFPYQAIFTEGIDWNKNNKWKDRFKEIIFREFHKYCGNHLDGHGGYSVNIFVLKESSTKLSFNYK